MARGPSQAQVLVTLLDGLAERERDRMARLDATAADRLLSDYEHRRVAVLARAVVVNERAVVQTLNVGYENVPDEHLARLMLERERAERELLAMGRQLAACGIEIPAA